MDMEETAGFAMAGFLLALGIINERIKSGALSTAQARRIIATSRGILADRDDFPASAAILHQAGTWLDLAEAIVTGRRPKGMPPRGS